MKRTSIIACVAAAVCVAAVSLAGWISDVEANFTGTTYNWTNDVSPKAMISIDQVACRWGSALTNTVELYRVDSSARAFLLATTSAQTNQQYCTFTPPGNGKYNIPNGDILRIVQTATNQCWVIITRTIPDQ